MPLFTLSRMNRQAVRIAHRHGCSLAIFAPAWTHEAQGATALPARAGYGHFLLRDRALWGSLWPFLCTKLPTHLPFRTSFCRGQGRKRRLHGEVLGPVGWYNLRHQQYQPSAAHGPHGFLLASLQRAASVSQRGLARDEAGQLRLRDSFCRRPDSLDSLHDQDLRQEASPTGSLEPSSDETLSGESSGSRKSLKSRLRRLFKAIFRRKGSKSDSDASDETVDATLAEEARRSMTRSSVKLLLDTDGARYALVPVPSEAPCLEPYLKDSFGGGSCLRLHPSDKADSARREISLFHCHFHINSDLVVCVVTKQLPGHEDQYLNIILVMKNRGENARRIVLVGRGEPAPAPEEGAGGAARVLPLGEASPQFRRLQAYLLLHEPDVYVAVSNAYGWQVRYYLVRGRGAALEGLQARAGLPAGAVLLGHLALCPYPADADADADAEKPKAME